MDCVSLSSPTNGHVSLNTTTFGSVATYICDDGYRLSGQSMTICQAEGTWSGSTPTCAIVDCGQLDNITSGQNTQPITTYGSSATYSCDSGYTLNGPNSRTCQADGYWSGSEPSCDLVDCGLVVAPTNGVVTLSSTTYLSVATYGCSTGYQLSGQNTQTCQADGTWSGNNPTCDIVDCGTPTTPTNGQANFVSINFTSVVAYSCDSGYVLNGSNSRFCQADGTWSGSEPTCANASTCEVMDCSPLTDPTNGQIDTPSITFGSVATYSCDNGYRLSGQSMTICQADGTWSGSTPTCEIVDCGQLDPITNGQITQPITTYGSSATYRCDSGYTLNGPNSRTCQADGYWSGSEPSCDLVDCGLVVAPTNGVVILSSTTYLSVATYGCSTGYQLSGQNTQTCQADGTWSGNNPTCDILNCSTPTTPTNGQASFVSINFTSVVAYSCDSGYVLNGSNSRFCQSDGTWSGSTPTCAIVDCGQLDPITNGQITQPITTYGSSATYSCDSGYTLNGPNSRTCQADGYWSGSEPSCDLVDCGLVVAPTNGVVILSSTTYLSVATYGCSTGYQLSGQNTQTCQADGTWSGNNPTCDILNCSTPTTPTNGQASFVSINFTSVVAYSCDSGYVLNGSNSRFCQSDGTWSGSEPTCANASTCEVMDCSPLTDPTNGQIDTPSIIFGSVATYSCDKGYRTRLSGQSMTICQANGTWSGSTPTCKIVDCGQLDDINNGQMTVSTTTYGSSATYSCNIGYRLNGPATTTCGADGYWSGSLPTCDTGIISNIGEQRSTNTTTSKEEDESSAIAVGVVLMLVIIAVAVLLLVNVVFFR